MLRNFFNTTVRIFFRNKAYSLINIIGLSVGLTVSLVISKYVTSELSYDTYHQYADRIYRINVDPFASIAPSFKYLLEADYSQIEEITRIFRLGKGQIKIGEDVFTEENIVFAEENLFEIFNVPLLQGQHSKALAEPGYMIISESMARKYFNSIDVVGKQILLDNDFLFQITGVFADMPYNTHFHMNMIVSYLTLKGLYGEGADDYFWGTTNFTDNATYTYFRVAKESDMETMISSFPAFIDNHLDQRENKTEGQPPSDFIQFDVFKVSDIHLHSKKWAEAEVNGNIQYVRIFSIVGIFILVIACINFINLNTARAVTRAKEIGLKKIIGATRRLLVGQFLLETFFFILLSFIFAYLLIQITETIIVNSLNLSYSLNPITNYFDAIMITVIIILTTLLAGLYPAYYLSAFRPVSIIKNEISKGRKSSRFRNLLVIFQFTISIGLILCVLIVFRQMQFIKKVNLGFDRENIILLPTSDEIIYHWPNVKNALENMSQVTSTTLSKRTPGSELLDAPGFSITLKDEVINNTFQMPHNRVDFDFFKTYGINIIAGRTFSREYSTDSLEAFIINESAVRELGLSNPEEAINLPVTVYGGRKGKIIGVAEDFNYESLKKEVVPIITYIRPEEVNTLAIKLVSRSVSESITEIKQYFQKQFPGYSFEFTFIDERINALYQNEARMLTIFKYFSVVTIIIAMIGLLGLSIYNTENRIKEIGIRKVNGATLIDILFLLVKNLSLWISIAFIIVLPLAYVFLNKWLESFAYKTNMPWWIFMLTLVGILIISWLSVFYQSLKAALKNPVEVLRYE